MSPTPPDTAHRSAATIVRRAPRFVAKRTKRWLRRRYYEWYFEHDPGHRARSAVEAKAAVAEADRILFLCWGNVCRSPMAERYLHSRLEDVDVDRVTPCSAGWGEYEGRPSPPDAVETAARHGVDLLDHRSRRLSPVLVDDVDVAFVMDYNDFHELTSRYPGMAEDTYFLGALLDDASRPTRIPDPHGRGPERFAETYESIARAVDELVAAIEGGASNAPQDGAADSAGSADNGG